VHSHFYAAERLHADSDISSSRFAIWRNALRLVAENPWTGVGWGNFNFAWTFSPFPDRPVAFFDHTHNLPLQLAVEIGLPATAAVLASLGWALWRARRAWNAPLGDIDPTSVDAAARAALAMLALLAVHSQLESPLWYAYFLLPAAWALGLFLGAAPPYDSGRGDPGVGADRAGRESLPTRAVAAGSGPAAAGAKVVSGDMVAAPQRPMAAAGPAFMRLSRLLGIAMLLGGAYAAWDHHWVEVIFAPPAGAATLDERIEEGQRSWLFGHHADYAAVTTEPRDLSIRSFRRPLHQLVDVRLLAAYMEALHAEGRIPEALYAAQRLREFRRDDAQAYFERCTPEEPAPPWLCETRPVLLDWRELDP
jgi:O-antigen ligase